LSDVEKMNCAQISFAPLGTKDIESAVSEVLEIVESSGIKHEIGEMSTILWASPKDLSDMIEKIQKRMNSKTDYILDIRISNTCGCGKDEKKCGI